MHAGHGLHTHVARLQLMEIYLNCLSAAAASSACRAPAAMPGKRMRPLIKEEPGVGGAQEAQQQQQAAERDGRRRRGEEEGG
jgi:hypothetical protein